MCINHRITQTCTNIPEEGILGGLENKGSREVGLCNSAPGEVGMGCSSPVDVESSLRRL